MNDVLEPANETTEALEAALEVFPHITTVICECVAKETEDMDVVVCLEHSK